MLGHGSVPHFYRDSTCTFHALGFRCKAALFVDSRACPFLSSLLSAHHFPSDGTRFHRPRVPIWSYPISTLSPPGLRHLFRVHPTWHPAGPGWLPSPSLSQGRAEDLSPAPSLAPLSVRLDASPPHVFAPHPHPGPVPRGPVGEEGQLSNRCILDQSEAVVWGAPSGVGKRFLSQPEGFRFERDGASDQIHGERKTKGKRAHARPVVDAMSHADASCGMQERKMEDLPAGLRVLVVDDDPLCLMIVEKMLRRCNYTGA